MTDWRTFAFEKASPYAEKFNKVFTTIIETGLYKSTYFKMGQMFRKLHRYNEPGSGKQLGNTAKTDKGRILSIQCILLLGLGFSLSVISFISEILVIKSKET